MSEQEHDHAADLWYQYCFRPWPVCCAKCGHSTTDTQENLEAAGWKLGRTELCDECATGTLQEHREEMICGYGQSMGASPKEVEGRVRGERDHVLRGVRHDDRAVIRPQV